MATDLHGLLAEFAGADALLAAALRARRDEGYAAIEAYSPFPVDGLDEATGARGDRIPRWMLLGGVLGGAGTYALEWYSAVFDYAINVGGRPLASWPAFVPPALEMTVLGAVLFGVAAMLVGNGLPRLNHPLFAVKEFERATSDRFFLLLRAEDSDFDVPRARRFLEALAPLSVTEVPR